MSQPNSTRTPFDDDLVFDPNAPRHTQPLPAPGTNPQNAPAPHASAPGVQPPAAPYVHSAPQPAAVPPQVMPNRAAPDDDFIPTRKLHPSTRGGFLVAGGALAVLVLSVVIGKLLPRTPQSSKTTIITQTPQSGTIVMAPQNKNNDRLATQNSQNNENRDAMSNSEDADSSISVLTPNQAPASTRNAPRDTNASSDNAPRDAGTSNDSAPQSAPGNDGSSRTVRSRRGYALDVPDGFRLQRSGRRTVWTNRDGTNLLVETSGADGSPREGWEKLERSLSRKYGTKYRSHGIRETSINGRDAAIWEFELDLPSGTVRKIDMAVHDGKRGYAVLGSASAGKFEEARGKIENAINSFRVNDDDRDSNQPREYSRRSDSRNDSQSRDAQSRDNNSDVVGEISRAAGDAAKSAASSVAAAARQQVAESGIAERVKGAVKNTVNGAVNRAVDGAVDGVTGQSSPPRQTPRASTRRRKIESPQPDSESENADAPARNDGY